MIAWDKEPRPLAATVASPAPPPVSTGDETANPEPKEDTDTGMDLADLPWRFADGPRAHTAVSTDRGHA
ncbi:unnamed protein product [Merluccius merluccius]